MSLGDLKDAGAAPKVAALISLIVVVGGFLANTWTWKVHTEDATAQVQPLRKEFDEHRASEREIQIRTEAKLDNLRREQQVGIERINAKLDWMVQREKQR